MVEGERGGEHCIVRPVKSKRGLKKTPSMEKVCLCSHEKGGRRSVDKGGNIRKNREYQQITVRQKKLTGGQSPAGFA